MPERRRAEVQQLIALINEQLWVGHFDLWTKEGIVMFRHALLLAGGVEASGKQCEALLDTALDACERYFRRSSSWSGPASRRAKRSAPRCSRPPARRNVLFDAAWHRAIAGMMRVHEARRSKTTNRLKRVLAARFVLVGAGKMGGAMLEGWLARGLDPEKHQRDGSGAEPARAQLGGARLDASIRRGRGQGGGDRRRGQAAGCGAADLPSLKPRVGQTTLVVSIMAGKTLALPAGRRCRPARRSCGRCRILPAAIGRGITVAVPTGTSARRSASSPTDCSRACGAVEWVEDEKLLDAVTAVSGSGPGLCVPAGRGAHARPAVAAGLPADLAARLARETIAGAGELLQGSKLDAATLRKNVTSPGGTTAAALDVLMGAGGLDPLLQTAVATATRRSRELAG